MAAASVFVANRLVLALISVLTSLLFYDVGGTDHGFFAIWRRWDVLWYTQVADHGYSWHAPPVQSDLAFFPLYPLLEHILTVLSPLSAYAAGLAISTISFALALYLLHRLVVHDFGADVAERAVYYVGLFPTALFFFTAYSEALYLACSLGCVYALRLRRWWVAGLCGMAATLTREVGLLLIVPIVIEIAENRWTNRRSDGSVRTGRFDPARTWRAAVDHIGSLALIPLGLLAFIIYLQCTVGDGLLFLKAQQAWERSLAWPWQGVARAVHFILHSGNVQGNLRNTYLALRTITILDLSCALVVVVLIIAGAWMLPRSYTAYAAAVWLAVLITPVTGDAQPLALMSVSRFTVTLFPPFIVLALLGRYRLLDRLVLVTFVALLALYTVIFVRGRWIA
jgi:Gpi18-like mannosyltransferase